MLQGNYYVAIFKPVLTGSGRMVTDGVYRPALEMVALWFQHVMLLKPCVLCIYERCALFGVMGAGLVGAIAPKKRRCDTWQWLSGFTAPGRVYNWRMNIR